MTTSPTRAQSPGLTQSHIQVAGRLMSVAKHVGAHVEQVTLHETNHVQLLVRAAKDRESLARELGFTDYHDYTVFEQFSGVVNGVGVVIFGGWGR